VTEGAAFVGRPILRREDAWLLRGSGCFVDDVPLPRTALHLAFVLSAEAHARITAIDASAARALPGVVDVLTGDDLARLVTPLRTRIDAPGYRTTERDVVARDRVRFVGEAVAVVVAESPYIAQDGIELVGVEYDRLPSTIDVDLARTDEAACLHDTAPNNLLFHSAFSTPRAEDALRAAPRRLKETFRLGRVAAVPTEPRGCVAIPERGGASVTLHTSTQVPHIVRTAVAECVGLSESRLRVIVPDVGGGFGMKAHVFPEEIIVTALARKYGRAVKWIQDRREDLLTNAHARDHRIEIEAGFDEAGVIAALRVEVVTNAGAYSSFPYGCTLEPLGAARMLVSTYRIRDYAYTVSAVATNTCPTGAYRGTGQPTAFMAMEGMMDRIGRSLGLDPAEVRLRNMVAPADMPYVNAVGARYDTGDFVTCLRKGLGAIDYDGFRRAQPADRLSGRRYRGIGICSFTEVSGIGARGWQSRGVRAVPGFDAAKINIDPSGKITAFISQATAGQGHFTTFAQLVADELGARLDDVTIVEGDTATSPYGSGAIASRGAVAAGGAVIRVSARAADKLKRIASTLLEAAPQDIVLREGAAQVTGVPGLSVTFGQIAETAYATGTVKLPEGEDYGLDFVESYDPPPATMANAVHIVAVSVDAETGQVAIDRYVVVHDCGRVINPMIVDGQIRGGIAQGLGEALMEKVAYSEEGQLLNANLLDYLLPTAMDVPRVELLHMESPSVDALGGFKGVGEGGVIGAVPAIAGAVADALAGIGVNIREIPLQPSVIAGLIRDATNRNPTPDREHRRAS